MGSWISLVGMATLIAVGVVLSKDRRAIHLRTVGAAFALLVSLAGSMLAGYAAMGIRIDYLVAASVMAAPPGLVCGRWPPQRLLT